MYVNVQKTLKALANKLQPDRNIPLNELYTIYSLATKLRSQLIGIIYENENRVNEPNPSGIADILTDGVISNDVVELTIEEPLPPLKELTPNMHDHWLELVHAAIGSAAQKQRLPYFDKAFVLIEITTPKLTDNTKLWDTSNRAVNLIINNLKGIFFKDDNHEHMAFGVVGKWGNDGRTIIRIIPFERINKLIPQNSQATKRCCNLT